MLWQAMPGVKGQVIVKVSLLLRIELLGRNSDSCDLDEQIRVFCQAVKVIDEVGLGRLWHEIEVVKYQENWLIPA